MSDGEPLSAAFPAPARAAARAAGVDLDEVLTRLWQSGRAAWPEVDAPAAAFAAHLARHLTGDHDIKRWVEALNGSDLYLACACAAGGPAALGAFERTVLSQVPRFLTRINRDPAFADEVRQVLRERLLCAAPGATPRIADYAGIGALSSFVRVAAVRTALNLRRNMDDQDKEELDEAAVGALPAEQDPELMHIRRRYQPEFLAALREAFGGLAPDQRNVLRLRFARGLSLDQIAAVLKINRATAVRWLAAARGAILEETQRLLRQRLGIAAGEVDSLVRFLRSQLEMSLASVLRDSADP